LKTFKITPQLNPNGILVDLTPEEIVQADIATNKANG
jgi:hypothetical protein